MAEENVFARDLQVARDSVRTLNNLDGKDLSELFHEMRFSEGRLNPAVFAQILMEHFPANPMLPDEKMFWVQVADHLGPDYIREFRRVGGFMNKLGEF